VPSAWAPPRVGKRGRRVALAPCGVRRPGELIHLCHAELISPRSKSRAGGREAALRRADLRGEGSSCLASRLMASSRRPWLRDGPRPGGRNCPAGTTIPAACPGLWRGVGSAVREGVPGTRVRCPPCHLSGQVISFRQPWRTTLQTARMEEQEHRLMARSCLSQRITRRDGGHREGIGSCDGEIGLGVERGAKQWNHSSLSYCWVLPSGC
jgi:hypothetical protein